MSFILPILEDPTVDELENITLPSETEYNYWKSRSQRIFYIDYDIDEDKYLLELGKTILQMNFEEKDIPEAELKPIYIFIHTFGGELNQAYFLCDLIQSSRIPIYTIGMGVTMSAGFLILIAGHKRLAFKHCNALVHSGSAGFSGTAEQIEEAQNNYKKLVKSMEQYILERTSIDQKLFNKNKNKDWYLTSEELLKYNIVDKIIGEDCKIADILSNNI